MLGPGTPMLCSSRVRFLIGFGKGKKTSGVGSYAVPEVEVSGAVRA